MPGAVSTEFAANALYAPQDAKPMAGAQSVEEVAAAIVDLIDHPRAEVYTNPTVQLEMVKRYYEDVGAFEERMGR